MSAPAPPTGSRERLLDRWLEAVVATPGLTALRDLSQARSMLLDDALRGLELVGGLEGPIVDVGSGGGTPGLPLAVSLPDRDVTLLEAARRKADFLAGWRSEIANLHVVWGRAEEQPVDTFGVAVAKALAKPVTAVEWCLPLVRPGGTVVLWVARDADCERVGAVARKLGGELGGYEGGLLVVHKTAPTPPGFPRRAGMAKKRPLA